MARKRWKKYRPGPKAWLRAMRLRTLPLSLAGIILGSGIAAYEGYFNWKIFVLALLTAASYQILSNLANDYGDGMKGTDDFRVGPLRTIQAGLILPYQMRRAMFYNTVISIVLTYWLLKTAFPHTGRGFYLYFFLGLAAIWAAVKYTVGKKAYGYYGLGDLFVLVFFGWVSVAGVWYLYVKHWNWQILLPATAIGLLSVAVLNLNNMRDLENDKRARKHTLPVHLGRSSAEKYHRVILILSFLLMLYFTSLISRSPWVWLSFAIYIPLWMHQSSLDPDKPATYNLALKKVSILTFLFALIYALLLNLL